MQAEEIKTLSRDCEVVQIPSGHRTTLPAGSEVRILQELGGSYTVGFSGGLARLDGKDADAIGLTPAPQAQPAPSTGAPKTKEELEKEVWNQMRSCFDPEIPVNIVDLGLIYDCQLNPSARGDGFDAAIKMTLTAPGCGMGEVLKQDVENKVRWLEGIDDVQVELVWDPPWNQGLMTEAARLQLGLM